MKDYLFYVLLDSYSPRVGIEFDKKSEWIKTKIKPHGLIGEIWRQINEFIENKKSEDLMSTFKVMERRLFIYIMNPAMIASWIFGVLLIHTIGIDNFGSLWLQLKLLFVIILTIYHFFLFQCLRKFAENNNSFSPKFYRIINEIPTILLIAIIFIIVFKPL